MPRKKKSEFVPVEIAEMIAADLPDGAYFAMMEELTGMEPAELALYDEENDDGQA